MSIPTPSIPPSEKASTSEIAKSDNVEPEVTSAAKPDITNIKTDVAAAKTEMKKTTAESKISSSKFEMATNKSEMKTSKFVDSKQSSMRAESVAKSESSSSTWIGNG